MSCGDSRFDSTWHIEYPALPAGIRPHPDSASLGSALPPQSQANPSFFFGAVAGQYHPPANGHEPQTTSCNSDQSASRALRTASPTTFPVHPLPPQFAPGSLHTPYDRFPGQYVMSTHPPLFQNQPTQTPGYGYPIGPYPYPPTQYFPLPPHEAQPYFQHQSTVRGRDSSYEQAHHLPSSILQFATSNLGPSHARSYDRLPQYAPHLYSSTDRFGLTQQHPSVAQWYYGPDLSGNTFAEGDPAQAQQHPPINYAYRNPRTQCPRPITAHSTASDPLPSPGLDVVPSRSSAAIIASRKSTSPAAGEPPEQIPLQRSPKTDSQKSVAGTSRPHDRPLVRRHYHPHPPPNRSEWVMWVGNVPNDAAHDELWRFLKQPAPASPGSQGNIVEGNGLKSIFLISRSNCAFANYQSEEHLNRAINQFNGRKLRPHDRRCPRLVCRARRKEDDLRAGVGAQRGMGIHTHYVKNVLQKESESLTASEEATESTSPQSDPSRMDDATTPQLISRDEESLKSDTASRKIPTRSPSSYASTTSSFLARHFPKRFFILKSLTRYDLDLSIQRGVWATQKHNEVILDQAFRTSKEVILVFSVNRSGEFYGYARMASGISRGSHNVSWAPRGDSSSNVPSPSTSRMLAHGILEQPSSPEIPCGRQLTESSPSLLASSPEETNDSQSAPGTSGFGFAAGRRSAPPAVESDPGDPGTADLPPPGFSFTSAEPDSFAGPPALRAKLERHPAVRVAPKAKGDGTDDLGPPRPLLPVVEETHAESGVEEAQLAQPAIQFAAMDIHSEGLERDESWGGTFRIEWLRTQRVPFHRTRHLRNPWNHDREIKVSRDGTELEPSVGQQLVESWSSLADERTGGDDGRRTAGLPGGRHGAKTVPKPGARALKEPS